MVVYYNVQRIPQQEYKIIGQIEKEGKWTGKAMIEHSIQPWKYPQKEISSYLIEGRDGRKFYVDADVLLRGIMHHLISITNARISGGKIIYDPYN